MKHILNLFWITIVALFFYFVVVGIVEARFLSQRIIPFAGTSIQGWLSDFRYWGGAGILMAWLASVCWYALAQWVFRVNNLSDAGRRGVWGVLMLIPLAAVVAAFIFTRRLQAGMELALALYVANALLCYYLATVFFSPPAHKYVPLFASALRRW